jgi:hypothetical protein
LNSLHGEYLDLAVVVGDNSASCHLSAMKDEKKKNIVESDELFLPIASHSGNKLTTHELLQQSQTSLTHPFPQTRVNYTNFLPTKTFDNQDVWQISLSQSNT